MQKLAISIILLLSACSTIKEDNFLHGVKNKKVYEERDLIRQIGSFSEDGRIFMYNKEDLRYQSLQKEGVAYYTFSTDRYTVTLLGNKIELRNPAKRLETIYYLAN